jgi:hypothetical protein
MAAYKDSYPEFNRKIETLLAYIFAAWNASYSS